MLGIQYGGYCERLYDEIFIYIIYNANDREVIAEFIIKHLKRKIIKKKNSELEENSKL